MNYNKLRTHEAFAEKIASLRDAGRKQKQKIMGEQPKTNLDRVFAEVKNGSRKADGEQSDIRRQLDEELRRELEEYERAKNHGGSCQNCRGL